MEKTPAPSEHKASDREIVANLIDRIEVRKNNIRVTLKLLNDVGGTLLNPGDLASGETDQTHPGRYIDIPWLPNPSGPLAHVDEGATRGGEPDPALVQAVARAHSWKKLLIDGEHTSIESLAIATSMHPKVIRKGIRLAFLAPEITEAIVLGCQPKSLTLTDLQQATSLSWSTQSRKLRIGERAHSDDAQGPLWNISPARDLPARSGSHVRR